MLDVWKHALDSLRRGERTILMVVVNHRGSVPGTTGAMAVLSESGMAGTIGGGIVEKEISEQASTFDGRPEVVHYDHTAPNVDSLCMGIQDIALLPVTARDQRTIEAIVAVLESDGQGLLHLGPSGIGFTTDRQSPRQFSINEKTWSFVETLGRLDTLYQIGGGHVSLALSPIMATLGFRIVVMDNREELPTMTANHWASETRVVDYAAIADQIPEGEHSWVTIMTHGHRDDARVLEQLAEKKLHYLGMMGSKAKVKQVFAGLVNSGTADNQLEWVHAPIGIPIGSHTPEEIAVSVAAEIVEIRNRP